MGSAWELVLRLSLWMSLPLNLGAAYILANPGAWPGQMLGLPSTVHPIYAGIAAMLVALFGLVYGWLALQPAISRPLLAVGSLGKAGFFVLVAALWMLGEASGRLLAASTADLTLAALWLAWLLSAEQR